jgi:ERCC4-type nuclease
MSYSDLNTKLKLRISPLEKEYVFEELDRSHVEYVKEELSVYYCVICGAISRKRETFVHQGGCDNTDITREIMGDIVGWNYNYVIERKKGIDLLRSLDNDRLYFQLQHLNELFSGCCALVFEGTFEDIIKEEIERVKVYKGEIYKGVLSRIDQLYSISATCTQYGVSFLQVPNLSELIKMLRYFDYKCGQTPKIRTQRKQIHEPIPKIVTLLTGIEGIGLIYALRLFRNYRHLQDLIVDLQNDSFKKTEGFGEKRIELLKEWLIG